MPTRKEIDLSKRCVSDLVGPELLVSACTHTHTSCSYSTMCHQRVWLSVSSVSVFLQVDSHSSKSIPIVITVIIVMILSTALGVLFVKKYVCGGRLVGFSMTTSNMREHDLFFVFLCTAPWPDILLNVPCRFLVHRYSVLQQHVEDNATDVMDEPLETNHTHNGKIEFHDDSDEVQWISITPPFLWSLWEVRCYADDSQLCLV